MLLFILSVEISPNICLMRGGSLSQLSREKNVTGSTHSLVQASVHFRFSSQGLELSVKQVRYKGTERTHFPFQTWRGTTTSSNENLWTFISGVSQGKALRKVDREESCVLLLLLLPWLSCRASLITDGEKGIWNCVPPSTSAPSR